MEKKYKWGKCWRCGKAIALLRANRRYCGHSHKKGGCAYEIVKERHRRFYKENKNGYAEKARKRMKITMKETRSLLKPKEYIRI